MGAWTKAIILAVGLVCALFGAYMIGLGVQVEHRPHPVLPDTSATVVFPNAPNYVHWNRSM